VLAGEPNGQIVLVLRPTSAVPDEVNRAQLPAAIEGLLAEALRLCTAELWAGFAQKKAALDLPPPKESKAAYSRYFFPAQAEH